MLNSITRNKLLERKTKEIGGKEAFRCPITAKLSVSKMILSIATAHSLSSPIPCSIEGTTAAC